MSNSTTGTLNSNDDKSNGVGMTLTDEKQITLIVSKKTGSSDNHHVGLEISGGITGEGLFVDVQESLIVGEGVKTIHHNAGYVKAKVFKPEGDDSEVNVTIIAR